MALSDLANDLTIPKAERLRALGVVGRFCSGTSSKNSDYRVLWLGNHVALVQWKGGAFSHRGTRDYIPGDVQIVPITDPRLSHTSAPAYNAMFASAFGGRILGRVHTSDTQADDEKIRQNSQQGVTTGRLTAAILMALTDRAASVDLRWVVLTEKVRGAKEDIEQQEQAQAEREAQRAALLAAVAAVERDVLAAIRAEGFGAAHALQGSSRWEMSRLRAADAALATFDAETLDVEDAGGDLTP